MKTVWVEVETKDDCEDYENAVGLWEIELDRDLEPSTAAGAALDVFHGNVPIAVLEDYEFSVLDPSTRSDLFEPDEYEHGSGGGGKVVGKIERDDVSPSP